MTVTCTACQTSYRFDENRIPVRGINVRCTRCRDVFRLFNPASSHSPKPADSLEPDIDPRMPDIQRLARVVLSDLEVYNPGRLAHAIEAGRFFDEFRSDLEEARRIARKRFSDAKDPVALFDRALLQICAERANNYTNAR